MDNNIKQLLENKFKQPLDDYHNRRIVFWNDPDKEYIDIIDDLSFTDIKIVKLNGNNNFEIKKLLSHDDLDSNFLVYNPISYDRVEDDWLLDIEFFSDEFRADKTSNIMQELNIYDSAVLRFKVKEYSKYFDNSSRKEKLLKYNNSINTENEFILAILCSLTCSTEYRISSVIYNIIYDPDLLGVIDIYGSVKDFWELVNRYTGYEGNSIEDLANTILVSALSLTVDEKILKNKYALYLKKQYDTQCYNIVDDWFHYENNEYVEKIITDVGRRLEIIELFDSLEIGDIAKSDIFPHINGSIVKKVFNEIKNGSINIKENLDLVERRRTLRFYEEYKNYYEGIYYISKIQELFKKYSDSFHYLNAKDLAYMYDEELYLFDTYYRKFQNNFMLSQKNINVHLDDDFKECVDYIEKLYKNWYLRNITINWVNTIKDDISTTGLIKGLNHQIDFYNNNIKEDSDRMSFVIISDALRYETAKELKEVLAKRDRSKVSIAYYQGILPSITEYGMAALLPGRKEVVNDEILIGGLKCNDTASRQQVLQNRNKESIAITSDSFMALKKEERDSLLKGKRVVYIYHNEIDAIGDKSNTEKQVFDACEEAIKTVSNLIQVINNYRNGCHVLITADHGFLYNYNPLEESDKLSKTHISNYSKIGRRFIIGTDKTEENYLLKFKMLINDSNNSLVGYSPLDVVRIKMSGGGENYVHGGVSIQEMIIPVITYDSYRSDSKEYQKNSDRLDSKPASIQLINESRKISNNIFNLDFYQKEAVSGKVTAANYEIYMVDSNGNAISDVAKIIADKTSDDASERKMRIRLSLKPLEYKKSDSYYLRIMNVDTNELVEQISYEINIAFSNEFEF